MDVAVLAKQLETGWAAKRAARTRGRQGAKDAAESTPIDCPKCGGAGERTKGNTCATCNGSGQVYLKAAAKDASKDDIPATELAAARETAKESAATAGGTTDALEDQRNLARVLTGAGYKYVGGAEYMKGDISFTLYGEDWAKVRITKDPDHPVPLASGSGSVGLAKAL